MSSIAKLKIENVEYEIKDSDARNELKKINDKFSSEIDNINENIKTSLSNISTGTPLMARSTEEMTDTSRIYVDTTDGYWYYYSDNQWNRGGVYQATQIGNEVITDINVARKTIKPDKLSFFTGYNIKDNDLYTNDPEYDKVGRSLNGVDYHYGIESGDNFRAILTRIPRDSYITINKEDSDRFKVAIFHGLPAPLKVPEVVICDDPTLNSIGFYSGNANDNLFLCIQYTASGETPNIDIIVNNRCDYDAIFTESNLSIFEKVECDNLVDDSVIFKGMWVGVESDGYGFRVDKNSDQFRTIILPLLSDDTYTIINGGNDRFRVALYGEHPLNYDYHDTNNIDFYKHLPRKLLIDDPTAQDCVFESGKYKFCAITYSTTGEECLIQASSSKGYKYVLRKSLIYPHIPDVNNCLTKDGKGYVATSDADKNNEIWTMWDGRLAFGMLPQSAPVPFWMKSQLLSDGTIIAHNSGDSNKNRWGFHIYEGYAKDNYSRMTMLLDKHNNEINNKKSLEYYYYIGSDHSANSYGNTKIGSDVAYHSFLFDRDKMSAYGEIDCKYPVTLARISPSNDLITTCNTVAEADSTYEPEGQWENNMKCLKYIALKNAENGAMFYDTDRNKVVVKVNGSWCDMNVTPVESGIYNF